MPSPALILEAVHELVRHGFEDLGLALIWCGYFDGNIGSKRVQEKCSFRYHHMAKDVPCAIEGLLRDEHVSCLGREEWGVGVGRIQPSQWGRRHRMAAAVHLSRNRLSRTCRDQASRVPPTHPAENMSWV